MRARDYIKIRGYDSDPPETADPGLFEMFQGIGSTAGSPTQPPTTPITSDPAVEDAIWTAQNDAITAEQQYYTEISEMLGRKYQTAPSGSGSSLWGRLSIVVQEAVEQGLNWVVSKLITAKTGNAILGEITGWLAEVALSYGIDYLKKLYERGQEICDAFILEDDALLTLTKSLENYKLRETVLLRHTEQIENFLHHVALLESQAQTEANFEAKEVIETLIALQYNNEEIQFFDGSHFSLRGKYHGSS